MAEIEFIYNGTSSKIQCQLKDKMKDICESFANKAQIDKTKIYFLYNGKAITGSFQEMTFEQMVNSEDKKNYKMKILVNDNNPEPWDNPDIVKSKDIICPKCKENARIDIVNYKIKLSECKNKHKFENILLDQFENTQNINISDINCNFCKINNKSNSYHNIFYKCCSCNQNICSLCKKNHEKSHKIINYDDKNYICNIHSENYNSYCEECKKNLCISCESGHKLHKKKYFGDIIVNQSELAKIKTELKETINIFNKDVEKIIKILTEVKNKMTIYYKIIEDIINSYDIKNRNYELLYNLKSIQENNIIKDLSEINKESDIITQFTNIFNIYCNMNINEMNIIYKVNNENSIPIFGLDFVKKYKKKCKILYLGKEHELTNEIKLGILETFFNRPKTLEIKLIGIMNITNMNHMFSGCSTLFSIPDISNLNTTNVKYMNSMFRGCKSLSSLPDISKWNMSNVWDYADIFYGCENMDKEINIIYKINKNDKNIQIFGTKFVNNNKDKCKIIYNGKEQELIDKINMEMLDKNAEILEVKLKVLKNITDLSYMFGSEGVAGGCKSIISLPDISNLNTSYTTNMSNMFHGCSSLKFLPDISTWNTSNVKDMSNMFFSCSSLVSLPDISRWNVSNVKKMSQMFAYCRSLKSLPDISKWKISNNTDMRWMFEGCDKSLIIPSKFEKQIAGQHNLSLFQAVNLFGN